MKYSNSLLHEVLHCPMDPKTNDARAKTIAEYLGLLLATLWAENEGFSGKRPFGNGGWQWDVYTALVKNGLSVGNVYFEKDCGHDDSVPCDCGDGYEELEDITSEVEAQADEMIIQAIGYMTNHE